MRNPLVLIGWRESRLALIGWCKGPIPGFSLADDFDGVVHELVLPDVKAPQRDFCGGTFGQTPNTM